MNVVTWLAFNDELQKIAAPEKQAKEKISGTPKGLRALANSWSSKSTYALERAAAHTAGRDAAKQLKSKALQEFEPDAVKNSIRHGKIARESSKKALHGHGSEKNASIASHALELGGLGMLAAPTVRKAQGKPMSDRASHVSELGGLAVLGAHPAYELGKSVASKLKGVGKVVHASVKKADADLWEPATGRVIGQAASANRGVSTVASMAKKPAFTMDHLKKGYEAIGKKAPLSVSSALSRVAKHASVEKTGSATGAAVGALIGTAVGVAAPIAAMALKKELGTPAWVKTVPMGAAVGALLGGAVTRKKEKTSSIRKEAKLPMAAGAMMKMHGLAEASRAAAKPVAQAVGGFTKKLNPQMMANHVAKGGHAWNPAAQASRAISL